ncbi:MAG: methylated-DNA--[protein]-cysteine S-methyltransferase [SAR324 cluster bacterium]|nr:methylated-DNA--[protein]-cysteine S-methyltransferase [SAR324 cluster bacterium]
MTASERLIRFTRVPSPHGPVLLAGRESGLVRLNFQAGTHPAVPAADWIEDPVPLAEAARQLEAYFAGELREFTVTVEPEGTSFQQTVWRELRRIPYGKTISYGELARRAGKPKGARAVGAANGANPVPVIVPCHRVIGADGSLTGYGEGLPIKAALLELEQSAVGQARLFR